MKTVLITGGSRGIGKCIAENLAKDGFNVVLNYNNSEDIEEDVRLEQKKINSSDAIVFIYPVFWTEAPAKLVGWFDRVWTYGFAYGEKTMKLLDKGIILCTAGNTKEDLEKYNLESNKDFDVIWYNTNIHPKAEYEKRKETLKEYLAMNKKEGIFN